MEFIRKELVAIYKVLESMIDVTGRDNMSAIVEVLPLITKSIKEILPVSDEDDIDIFLSLGRASNMVNTQFVCDVLYDMSSEKKTWLSKKLDIIACADGPMTDKEQEYVDSITFIMQNKVPSEIIKALFK